jgi:uncharacterized protein (TIGR00730 family)
MAGFAMNDLDPKSDERLVRRAAIHRLLSEVAPKAEDARVEPLILSMIESCLGLADDGVEVHNLKLVDAALAEIRAALACFRKYPGARKVTTFGSARTRPDEPQYILARDFSRKIADSGFMVITGAGPGIMQACQQGAGRERSFGVNIRLPFENIANEVIRGDHKLVEFKYFFTRKLFFLKETSAVVLFPGGFGTHDESFEVLTLVQTGKSPIVPIVFLDVPGATYWRTWDEYVREHLLRRGLISPEDLSLYKIMEDPDLAVDEIGKFYRIYHSSRVMRRRLVVRTNVEVTEAAVAQLSEEFADILNGKPIARRGPYEEEADEPRLLGLPRLVLHFDMKSYGRLRRLIDRLNEIG